MLKHTRVSSVPDTMRMSAALARPGADPRAWVSYAIVTAVGVDEEGVFADVTMVPTMDPVVARVGAEYAGPGFGLYAPLEVNDEILVGIPSGDPQHGVVVLRRLSSASDPLPDAAVAHQRDVVLVVKPGASLRIVVSGGGKVVLGDADADDPILRRSDLDAAIDVFNAHLHTGVTTGSGSSGPPDSSMVSPAGSPKVVSS